MPRGSQLLDPTSTLVSLKHRVLSLAGCQVHQRGYAVRHTANKSLKLLAIDFVRDDDRLPDHDVEVSL